MSTHTKFSPSGSHIWANCAGSAGFIENAKLVKVDNENSIAGTRAHFLLADAIRTNVHPKDMLSGMSYTDTHGKWTPDDEMINAVEFAYAYVLLRSHEINALPVVEDMLDPSLFVGGVHGEMDGFCDIYIKAPNYLEVMDFKYGMDEVQIVDNTQLELYGAGVISKYAHEGYIPQSVQLTILQPRIKVLGQSQIKTMVMTMVALQARWKYICSALDKAKQANPQLTAGEWCKHCPALGKCSSNNEQSLKVLGYNPLDVVDQAMEHVDVKAVPDKQLVEIFTASKQIKQMLIACEAELTLRVHNKPVDGVKLVSGAGSKSWNASEDEIRQAVGELDEPVPASALYINKFISPAQSLKLSWFDKPDKKGRVSKTQKDKFTELMTINKGKPMLVFENDSREAIGSEVEKMFKDAKVDTTPKGWQRDVAPAGWAL